MGIFDSNATKLAKKQEEQERNAVFLNNLNKKLADVSPEQAKEDLTILILSLVGFFGKENPKLFTPGKEEMWYVKEFLRTVVNVGTGAMLSGGGDMEGKVKEFMSLFPVIQRYTDVK